MSPAWRPAGDGPVLPVDGAYVGHRAQQGLVTAHQRLVTQAQPLVQPLPENLLIALGDDGSTGPSPA